MTSLRNNGFGVMVPPQLDYVVIYFIQAGLRKKDALDFYKDHQANGWKGKKGKMIRDWKMYAWHWIWSR
ncbi:MAG: hypothetical protein P0Y49_09485 [Candidatus Pedobacter colombiensis]|uniref:Uncharacterized protein n=1 Tax=Candidatus Pedobacter colombiensis TaxID=3121371 RepID=A0AAJ5WF23_9SPHI|nr:hypothetical protein [Pedobacter sp.]WEK21372.1 MAG: hypothetical protein P0Y49_09485 [Pedobacter sp.]